MRLPYFVIFIFFTGHFLSGQEKLSGGPDFDFYKMPDNTLLNGSDTLYLLPNQQFSLEARDNSCTKCYDYKWSMDGTDVSAYSSPSEIYVHVYSAGVFKFRTHCTEYGELDWWHFVIRNKFTVYRLSDITPITNVFESFSLCKGDSLQLKIVTDSTTPPCTSYQWRKNGLAISGATLNTCTIKDTGVYSIEVNCPDFGVVNFGSYNVVCPPALPETPLLALYPNPAKEKLFIRLDDTKISTIIIYDTNGGIVFEKRQKGPSLEIDVLPLEDGLYFVSIFNGSMVTRKTFIKDSSY